MLPSDPETLRPSLRCPDKGITTGLLRRYREFLLLDTETYLLLASQLLLLSVAEIKTMARRSPRNIDCLLAAGVRAVLPLTPSCPSCYKHPLAVLGLCFCFLIIFFFSYSSCDWSVWPPIANTDKGHQLFTCMVYKCQVSNFDRKTMLLIRYSEKDLDM